MNGISFHSAVITRTNTHYHTPASNNSTTCRHDCTCVVRPTIEIRHSTSHIHCINVSSDKQEGRSKESSTGMEGVNDSKERRTTNRWVEASILLYLRYSPCFHFQAVHTHQILKQK